MSKLFKNAIVEKRNVLNELRSNNMTLQELRFFSIYLSKIDPYNIDTRCVRFPIEDFQRIMGLGKLNIGQLRASTDSLLCKIVHVPDESGRGMRAFQLFKECHIFQDNDGSWYMEIDAHDKALPLMFDFKNRYFKYELWNALRLKSPNQVRMYEILKQYEGIGKRELSITELRALIGIGKSEYSGRTGWSDFKKKVLDSCQQALKETTDICYTYERGKAGKGGKWLTIIFYIKKNEDYVDRLTLDEFIARQPNPDTLALDTKYENSEFDNFEDDSQKEINYGGALANLLGEVSCHNEFSPEQIRFIQDLVIQYVNLTGVSLASYNDYDLTCCDYLSRKFDMMNAYDNAKQRYGNRIGNRFKYLCKMIQQDIDENEK